MQNGVLGLTARAASTPYDTLHSLAIACARRSVLAGHDMMRMVLKKRITCHASPRIHVCHQEVDVDVRALNPF